VCKTLLASTLAHSAFHELGVELKGRWGALIAPLGLLF